MINEVDINLLDRLKFCKVSMCLTFGRDFNLFKTLIRHMVGQWAFHVIRKRAESARFCNIYLHVSRCELWARKLDNKFLHFSYFLF